MRSKLRLGIDELTRASIEDEELTQVPEASATKAYRLWQECEEVVALLDAHVAVCDNCVGALDFGALEVRMNQ